MRLCRCWRNIVSVNQQLINWHVIFWFLGLFVLNDDQFGSDVNFTLSRLWKDSWVTQKLSCGQLNFGLYYGRFLRILHNRSWHFACSSIISGSLRFQVWILVDPSLKPSIWISFFLVFFLAGWNVTGPNCFLWGENGGSYSQGLHVTWPKLEATSRSSCTMGVEVGAMIVKKSDWSV